MPTESSASASAAPLPGRLTLPNEHRLAAMLLGGDVSGGAVGTQPALTLSNALTNLSVGCWGGLKRLEPVAPANLRKWRRELEWYLAPLESIVVKEAALRTLDDGSTVEYMESVTRADIKVFLPKLYQADQLLQSLFGVRLAGSTEWCYAGTAAAAAAATAAAAAAAATTEHLWWGQPVWLSQGKLSAGWTRELVSIALWALRLLQLCHRASHTAHLEPAQLLARQPVTRPRAVRRRCERRVPQGDADAPRLCGGAAQKGQGFDRRGDAPRAQGRRPTGGGDSRAKGVGRRPL